LDASLHCFATFSMDPPGWVATYQLSVTGPPLSDSPHPVAATASDATAAIPTSRSLSPEVPISPPPAFDWPTHTLSDRLQTAPEFHAEDRYLAAVAGRLRTALADGLVGVYAGGSYALGDYFPGRSDLDVVAVVGEPLTAELRSAIVDQLRHESLPCPARLLELVVYQLQTARSGSPSADFELNLNTGAGIPVRAQAATGEEVGAHWFAIDRSVLSQAAIALWGPPAAEVFAPIPRAALLPVLAESVRWHRDHPGEPSDAVLNACRALRFADEGRWSSKPAAGRWAVAHGLAPQELVAGAIRARSDALRLDGGAVTRFLRTAEKRLAAGGS
jgi:hypothetical protein